MNNFRPYQLQKLVPLPWNDVQDELNMLRKLRDGSIAALIIDKSFADYYTSINCDLFEVCPSIMAAQTSLSWELDGLTFAHPCFLALPFCVIIYFPFLWTSPGWAPAPANRPCVHPPPGYY